MSARPGIKNDGYATTLIRNNAKSVELIIQNAERGMSRAAMKRIWSEQLINMVLGHREPK